jgi:hypothetical protein
MLFTSTFFVLVTSSLVAAQDCDTTWKCHPTSSPPVIDADLSEWVDVEGISTSLAKITGESYMDGEEATYKCMYDSNRIYLSLEIPGEFSFDTEDNHLCASIATMTKIGVDATYVNMGGCPEAMGGCTDDVVPDTCEPYRVDIGAHWELATTEQGVAYNIDGTTVSPTRTGNDPIANLDDEFAASPYCRFDDNDEKAGSEWGGAWAHTNPVDGEFGMYKFEITRTLKTPSSVSDAQMEAGGTYSFGVAFWDPFESESGWTDAGHYVTGCAAKWIDLELVTADNPTSASTRIAGTSAALLAFTGMVGAL